MDDLIKKAVQRDLIRKPSNGFSDKVMNSVFELKSRAYEYKPVISNRFLFGILSMLVGLIAYVIYTGSGSTSAELNSGWINQINNAIDNFIFTFNFQQINAEIEKLSGLLNLNYAILFGSVIAVLLLLLGDLIFTTKNAK